MSIKTTIKRNRPLRIILFVLGVAAGSWIFLIEVPNYTPLETKHMIALLTPLMVSVAIFGDKIQAVLLDVFKTHNVAEITLRGPIKEEAQSGAFGGKEQAISSKNVVKRIKKTAEKDYSAVIVNIDSPGGEVVPSEDIQNALEDLDVPTFTYVNNMCASGGYAIACGTDHIHARSASLVGSIGVVGNMTKFSGLGEKIGVHMERFVSNDHKDTHHPLKELDEDEREYLQGLIDDVYNDFVQSVSESRSLTPEQVRETRAEVFSGDQALEYGLVDSVGSRDEFLDRVRSDTGIDSLKIRTYSGTGFVLGTVQAALSSMAYSFGRGLGSAVTGSDSRRFKLEYRA